MVKATAWTLLVLSALRAVWTWEPMPVAPIPKHVPTMPYPERAPLSGPCPRVGQGTPLSKAPPLARASAQKVRNPCPTLRQRVKRADQMR